MSEYVAWATLTPAKTSSMNWRSNRVRGLLLCPFTAPSEGFPQPSADTLCCFDPPGEPTNLSIAQKLHLEAESLVMHIYVIGC